MKVVQRIRPVLVALLALWCASSTRGDTILLAGTSIPMRQCTVQAIRGGRVHFRDASGRREWLAIEEIQSLGFGGLAALDRAEEALRGGRHDEAIGWYLQARVRATTRVQEMWIHIRLAQTHDLRGDYVECAGHAAAVFVLDDDAFWRFLAPRSPMREGSDESLRETMARLHDAMRIVRDPALKETSNGLFVALRPEAQRRGITPQPASQVNTFSGRTVDSIMQWTPGGSDAARQPSVSNASGPSTPAATPPSDPPGFDRKPPASERSHREPSGDLEAIRTAIDDGDGERALAGCERLARDPVNELVPDLLYEYGRALREARQIERATVMWGRCSIEHPQTPAGMKSLIELAQHYRGALDDDRTARRLLQRAARLARAGERRDIEDVARTMLDQLPVDSAHHDR